MLSFVVAVINGKHQWKQAVEKASSTMDIALEIDATGCACPLPLLKAKQGLRQIRPGELLKVRATDPGSVRDIPAFVRQSGHTLVQFTESDGVFSYVLCRQDEPESPAC